MSGIDAVRTVTADPMGSFTSVQGCRVGSGASRTVRESSMERHMFRATAIQETAGQGTE